MTPDPRPSRSLEWFVWGGLGLITVVIAMIFVQSKSKSPLSPALPVYGQVPPFSLTNQNGRAVTQEDMRGKVWIADIIFTRCPTQCLKMSRQMAELEKDLAADPSVTLVSLTADPGFDTPPILKKYGARFGASDEQWQFFTGNKSDVYALALDGLKLSVMEKTSAEKESIDDLFIHSTKFAVIDRKGRLRAWFDGDNPQSKGALLQAVHSLKDEKER